MTAIHGHAQQAKMMLTRISAMLKLWKSAAEQFNLKTVWQYVCEHIAIDVAGFSWSGPPIVPKKLSYGVA